MVEKPEPRTKNQQYSFRNLVLWQKAQELALKVIRTVSKMPPDPAGQIILRQIVRSASSIGANIAEGHGRYTPGAHRNHLSIAKASAAETDSWLDLLRRGEFISIETEAHMHVACEEIIRMLTAKIIQMEKIEGKRGPSRTGETRAIYQTEDYAGDDPVLGSRS
jgi:four helix bundle protein